MITGIFESILQELGELIKIKDLKPDSNNSCVIKFKNGLEIQIEPDAKGEFLIIGSVLGTVHAGRFRESIFKEALRANGMPYPVYGFFSYSTKTNNLLLSDKIHFKDLNGTKVYEFIQPFSEKAFNWKESINRGEIPSLVTSYSGNTTHAGMFGMK